MKHHLHILALATLLGIAPDTKAQTASEATLTFSVEGILEGFGKSVAGIGDADGDGVPDILVIGFIETTDCSYEPSCAQKRIFQFSGATGALLNSTNYGASVIAGIDDLDGDGVDDFLVGGGSSSGQIRSGSSLLYIDGISGGSAVASAGDVDGDGVTDIIAGAHLQGPADAGRAYVYSGQTRELLHVFDGEFEDDGFGAAVAGAGDIDNDGYHDLIVGAPWNDAGGSQAGRVYIYSGFTGELLLTLPGPHANANFGSSVFRMNDLNSDGVSEVVVGAPGYNGAEGSSGCVFIISGASGQTLRTHCGTGYYQLFGAVLHGGRDMDGDNKPDLLVGAPASPNTDGPGSAYLVSGDTGNIVRAFYGESIGDEFGRSVSPVDDVNGDGIADILIGSPWHFTIRENGKAYLFALPQSAFVATDLNKDGAVNGTDLAVLLSGWGSNGGFGADLNGDGVVNGADLAILLAAWTG